jgi:hypothetical protein
MFNEVFQACYEVLSNIGKQKRHINRNVKKSSLQHP